jgi:wyosine [tRNA(Phe)-imidazoG37] synthetase (radical SAM superfamily)
VRLDTRNHDRDSAGLTYVYAVVSRRSRGVSVGVNLNPNRACNWRCVYCQVPGLVRGKGPPIDLALLERELAGFLDQVLTPAWMERHVPEGSRRLNDVAFSGDGEPTSSPDFEASVAIAAGELQRRGLVGRTKLVLITNGSLLHKDEVARGVERLARAGGEVWFKLDAVDEAGQRRINDSRTGFARQLENLERCARLCRTFVSTLALDFEGPSLDAHSIERMADHLEGLRARGATLAGVHLYGLERPSHQPEAPRLRALPAAGLEALAARLRARTGLDVIVSA